MAIAAFNLGIISLIFDYAYDSGFNPCEILFFRGFISLILTFGIDFTRTYLSFTKNDNTNKFNNFENSEVKQLNSANELNELNELTELNAFNELNDESKSDESHWKNNDEFGNGYTLQRVYKSSRFNYIFNLNGGEESLVYLILRGLGRTCSSLSFYFGLSLLSLGTISLLINTGAIWSVFLDKFWFKEKLYARYYVVTVLVVVGVVLITQPDVIFGSLSRESSNSSNSVDQSSTLVTVLGYVLGITSAMEESFGFGAMRKFTMYEKENRYIAIDKQESELEEKLNDKIIFAGMYSLSFFMTIFGLIFSLIVYHEFLYDNIATAWYNYGVLYVFLIGLGHVLLIYCINYAVARLKVSEVSLIALTEVIWAYILQIIFFDEIPDILDIGGIILIICSISFLFLYNIYTDNSH